MVLFWGVAACRSGVLLPCRWGRDGVVPMGVTRGRDGCCCGWGLGCCGVVSWRGSRDCDAPPPPAVVLVFSLVSRGVTGIGSVASRVRVTVVTAGLGSGVTGASRGLSRDYAGGSSRRHAMAGCHAFRCHGMGGCHGGAPQDQWGRHRMTRHGVTAVGGAGVTVCCVTFRGASRDRPGGLVVNRHGQPSRAVGAGPGACQGRVSRPRFAGPASRRVTAAIVLVEARRRACGVAVGVAVRFRALLRPLRGVCCGVVAS